jgi:hypothetical protein
MANKKITELTLASPSSSASVVGEDGGVAKRFPVSSFGGSSGGGGGIVTVEALPTEGNEDTIYKVYEVDEMKMCKVGIGLSAVTIDETTYIEIVDELPEVGQAFMDVTTGESYVYYNRTVGKGYVYVSQALSDTSGGELPVGWLDVEALGMTPTYINSLDEAADKSGATLYCLCIKKPHLYIYESGWVEIPIGFRIVHNPRLETITIVES